MIPRANLTGTLFKGRIRLGQFFSDVASNSVPAVTVNQLIRASDKIESMQDGFTLQGALVNDYLLTHTFKPSESVTSMPFKDTDLGSEIVDYVILQTPSINISTGGTANFSLIVQNSFNAIVMPSPQDLLLYRTFQAISQHKQRKDMDYTYTPIDTEKLDQTPPPLTYANLKDFEHLTSKEGILDATSNWETSTAVSEYPDLEDDYITPKKHILKDAESDDDLLDLGKIFISRRKAAFMRFVYSNEKEFTSIGIKLPLRVWGTIGGFLGSAAMSLVKDVITSDTIRDMLRKGWQVAKDTWQANPGRGRLAKAMTAGISAAAGVPKGKKIAEKMFNKGSDFLKKNLHKSIKSLMDGKLSDERAEQIIDTIASLSNKRISQLPKEIIEYVREVKSKELAKREEEKRNLENYG